MVLLWIVKPPLAFWAIIITEVWQWTPFMFVILLAALANVDREQLEAAALDGAGRFQVLPPYRAAGDLAGGGASRA